MLTDSRVWPIRPVFPSPKNSGLTGFPISPGFINHQASSVISVAFCAIILSTDVDDVALEVFDQPLRNLPGSRGITISTSYIWYAESASYEYNARENDAKAEHPAQYRSVFDREKQRSCRVDSTPASPINEKLQAGRSSDDLQMYQHLAALVIILEVEGFAAKIGLTCLVKAVSGKFKGRDGVRRPPNL